MNGSIAIVVPCHNAGATLAATLESALAQDVPNDIIVVDDGSTDESLTIARSFEPRLRVISGPNRGASHARNKGIAATSSEWIVFLDADDMLEPGTLAKRLSAAKSSNADVVICDWVDLVDDGSGTVSMGERRSIDWPALEEDAQLATATHIWATTAAILYRRTLVEKIGGFNPDLPIIQDARFLFDAAFHGARFTHSGHVGARYRVLAGSLSRRAPARFWRDVLTNGAQIEALWQADGALSARQREALAGIYNNAARGLFRVGSDDYFEAVERQHALGPVPAHSRVAAPLARLVGLSRARQILSWVAR